MSTQFDIAADPRVLVDLELNPLNINSLQASKVKPAYLSKPSAVIVGVALATTTESAVRVPDVTLKL